MKLILPKKMLKRINVVSNDELKDLVPDKWLLQEYGGSLNFTIQDVIKQMEEFTESVRNKNQIY